MDQMPTDLSRALSGRQEVVTQGQLHQNQRRPSSQHIQLGAPQQGGQAAQQQPQGPAPSPLKQPPTRQSVVQQGHPSAQCRQQTIPLPTPVLDFRNAYATFEKAYCAAERDHRQKDDQWRKYCHNLTQESHGWQNGYKIRLQEVEGLKQQIQNLSNDQTVKLTALKVAHADEIAAKEQTVSNLQSERELLQTSLANERSANRVLRDQIQKQQIESEVTLTKAKAVGARSLLRTAILRGHVNRLQAEAHATDLLSAGLCMEVTRLEGELDVAVDDFARYRKAAEATKIKLEKGVTGLEKSIRKEQANSGNLQVKLDLEEAAHSVTSSACSTALANCEELKKALEECEKKRKSEVSNNLKLVKKNADLGLEHGTLERVNKEQKQMLSANTGSFVAKDRHIRDLKKECDILRKESKETADRNTVLFEAEKKAKDAKAKVDEVKSKIQQKNSSLQAQVEQLQQDLRNEMDGRRMVEGKYDTLKTKVKKAEAARQNADNAERELSLQLEGNQSDEEGPPRKRFRPSNELTPPKSPSPSTDCTTVATTESATDSRIGGDLRLHPQRHTPMAERNSSVAPRPMNSIAEQAPRRGPRDGKGPHRADRYTPGKSH